MIQILTPIINKPSSSLNNQANYTPIQINKSSNKDYNAKKEVEDLSQIDLEQFKKMQSPYKNEEIIKDENGEIVKRKEEKTIIILPGQTIEPKAIIETFEKPTVEVIQNEDGTSQSILRQTKIITNVENIPINNPKSSSKKGEGDLQLFKQIITHEYKTVSANKDDTDKKEGKDENKEKEGLNINLEKNMNEENKENVDKNNEMKDNDTIDKKLRYMGLEEDENAQKENANIGNEGNQKTGNKIEAKEKDKSKNKEQNLKSQNKKTKEEIDSMPKNIKNSLAEKQAIQKKEKEKLNDKSKELNKTLKEKQANQNLNLSKAKDKSFQDSANNENNLDKNKGKNSDETNLRKSFRRNKKGEKDNKQSDKEGNIKIVFELYEKCFKLGNKPGSEKDIAKIVEILIILEEKEWKDILNKLLKAFPKSSDLNKKILDLIINKKNDKNNKDKNKLKGKESRNELSSGKENQKESRSKSQLKTSGLKNKLKLEEDDNVRGETDKKLKFLENGGKSSLTSNNNFTVNSVNVANIGNLNFDGLFMDISKYQNKERDKNPFEGPSTFYKFYKLRQSRIKKKIIDMTNEAKNN